MISRTQPLDVTELSVEYTKQPRPVPDQATIETSETTICTDHMIVVNWTQADGWAVPELRPYGPISLMPTASCLHYATECFEGIRVYRGYDGQLRLFRPDLNSRRLEKSADRISLPMIEPERFEQLLMALISVDGPKWLPKDKPGEYLYIRPTIIGTQAQLGVRKPKEAMLYILLAYMSRFDTIKGGLRVITSPEDTIRAWTGGFGFAKLGANYGPILKTAQDAGRQGFDQILWLHGPQGDCTEAGACNFFVLWKRKEDGKTELITAPLDDKLILDGVHRRSCLELAHERLGGEEFVVAERRFNIVEVLEASREGRLLEAFCVGTAYYVTPVSMIEHRGQRMDISMGSSGTGGEVTLQMKKWLGEIMYGQVEHKWAVVVPEQE